MARVTPPAKSYHLDVPPGGYVVAARLDSDPLSAAGHLVCPSGMDCAPVISRAGYFPCRSVSCQPVLAPVRVEAGQGVAHVDIGDWGSLYALDRVWWLDEYGAPGPFPTVAASAARVSPSPARPLPFRNLPLPSTEPFTSEFDVPNGFVTTSLAIRLHLPGGWHSIPNPAQVVEVWQGTRDFATRLFGHL